MKTLNRNEEGIFAVFFLLSKGGNSTFSSLSRSWVVGLAQINILSVEETVFYSIFENG